MCITSCASMYVSFTLKIMHSNGPVSYTHLDVYKRQELQAEIEDGKKKIRQFENREKMLRQKLSKEERRTRSPVSYTHLDVYKRQPPIRAMMNTAISWTRSAMTRIS